MRGFQPFAHQVVTRYLSGRSCEKDFSIPVPAVPLLHMTMSPSRPCHSSSLSTVITLLFKELEREKKAKKNSHCKELKKAKKNKNLSKLWFIFHYFVQTLLHAEIQQKEPNASVSPVISQHQNNALLLSAQRPY